VISVRRVSLGGGYRYLMSSVAGGDEAAGRSNGLARYYASSGTPPGVFLGAGLADLDGGRGVRPGSQVSEEHLANMLVACADPVSGEALGAAPRAPQGAVPVAGFDLTFSPSKSVSVAWALADQGTKAVVYECHRRAVEVALAWAEAEVFRSRSGANGMVEEDLRGVVAASFTHWSSRADDPQLHDHVVVWNRARSVSDGRWRTLDSRAIFKATTTLSELHQGVLADLLAGALGVGWEARARRHSARPRYELAGVPEALMAEFSKRAGQVAGHVALLREAFVAAHGRAPSPVEDMRLHQRATLATRPAKSHTGLAELTEAWRQRADAYVPIGRQVAWVESLAGRCDLPPLRSDDLSDDILADAAGAVLAEVAERHATFSAMNVLAEAHRVLHAARFAGPAERIEAADRLTALAIGQCLAISAPATCHTPARYVRADGTSRLRPGSRTLYTTQGLLDAEARLLDAGRALGAPRVSLGTVARATGTGLAANGCVLSDSQALAVEKVATSGRWLDLLVGPAGTGKSTTMAALRAAWEAEHGPGSVTGLAPSATAAEVLGRELGTPAENTAKWLTEHRRLPELVARRKELADAAARLAASTSPKAKRLRAALSSLDEAIDARRLHAGQLVVVDEASLAGTFALDELVGAARAAGAKVLLVGDWAQLEAVEAGGAFRMLADDRAGSVAELTEVRRFDEAWERVASVELRLGHPRAIDAYESHGRVLGGEREAILDALYRAWRADVTAGKSSLMVGADSATVSELNARARAERVASGEVSAEGLAVADGQVAGVGDEVVTRENNRLVATGRRWVKNGDRWVVTATNTDGSMAVRRADGHGEVVLPAGYVRDHVELTYATTAHRAQGRTVTTAHAMVAPTTTREVLYVAATRGREANRLYVDTSFDPDPATAHDGAMAPRSAREVLAAVLRREGGDLSAHEALRRAQQEAVSFSVLANEYQTIAREAQQARFDELLGGCGLGQDELAALRASPAYGPLLAALREAEARGLAVGPALPGLVSGRPMDDAQDLAAVLHGRVDRWTAAAPRGSREADLVAGLVPRALGVTDPDMARALHEREVVMALRARELAEAAVTRGEPWALSLGPPPSEPARRETWWRAVSTVAAYREGWHIEADGHHLGSGEPVEGLQDLVYLRRAQAAVRCARTLVDTSSRAEIGEHASAPTVGQDTVASVGGGPIFGL
jgi:conjugative relaxase-like TrwC/TraI family protein